MGIPVDLIGRRFGLLTVVSVWQSWGDGQMWRCHCDCGGSVVRCTSELLRTRSVKNMKSCGCSRVGAKERGRYRKLQQAYYNMVNRCTNSESERYDRYGGRGITVCDEWLECIDAFFEWALSHGYVEGLSIERIDNDGNYEPSNCEWIPLEQQGWNKSTSRRLTWNGKTQTPRQWADELGVSYDAIQLRVSRKWSAERIFTQPFRTPRK